MNLEEMVKMTMGVIQSDFWKKWIKANAIEKTRLVETLPILKDVRCPLFSASLVNSYFEDLYLFMKDQYENNENNKGS